MLLVEASDREDGTMRERRCIGGSRSRERRCIVTREVLPESRLIRFVVGPENEIVPDLAAKLPGRGIWVSADRSNLERAVAKNLFARAAKADVRASADLPERVESLLVKRILDHLGLARRSGVLIYGFDNVARSFESRRKPHVLVEARDAAQDGRRKVLAAAKRSGVDPKMIDILNASEISMALGRENVIHAALFPGPLAERLVLDAERLGGFRPPEAKRTGPTPVPDERLG
jgi:hypothetical protein